jgi:hypothetical protein
MGMQVALFVCHPEERSSIFLAERASQMLALPWKSTALKAATMPAPPWKSTASAVR